MTGSLPAPCPVWPALNKHQLNQALRRVTSQSSFERFIGVAWAGRIKRPHQVVILSNVWKMGLRLRAAGMVKAKGIDWVCPVGWMAGGFLV